MISKQNRRTAPLLTQPHEMRTRSYRCGVETLNGYDAWALFEACAAGDVPQVKAFLAQDLRLVNAQYWYQFPIHMAVFAGNADIVKLLLEHGADPGQSTYTYNSWDKLLRGARERGYARIESIIIRAMKKRFNYAPEFETLKEAFLARDQQRIDVVLRRQPKLSSASDALGNNALHWSVMTRQLDWIKQFVKLGTPIDAQRADGQTPVLLAVNGSDYWYRATRGRTHPSLRNRWVMVGSLLAQGANYTISVAAAAGDRERVEELLREDANLARRLDSARRSPLSYAAREGYAHIVRLLLEHGADPNLPEDSAPNGLALFEACGRNDLEIARLLLEHGANPNAGSDSNGCCLTIAEVNHGKQAKPLQQLLRKHGAHTPPYAMTLQEMKQAIREKHPVVRDAEFVGNVMAKRNLELLDLYIDSEVAVPDRVTAAIYPRSPVLVRRLVERGLDPNRPDWLGRTLLHACAENADRSVAAMLLDVGADINARDIEFKGTPLAAAVRACSGGQDAKEAKKRRRMIRFLLKRGAATNLAGDEPWATPLAWARQRGLADVIDLMRSQNQVAP